MKKTLFALTIWTGAGCIAALAAGAPQIQFDQTVCNSGKTSLVATVSGVFKFKNAGDAVLKVEPPKPSCGCTVAELKPDTLQPGETGELPFTLHRGQAKAQLDKRIAVKSNDPQTPEVLLSPEALYLSLPDATNTPAERPDALVLRRVTIRSADGKPIELKNQQSSIKGIKVELVPKEAGKVYELVARLDEVPASTVSGNVSFETSVAAQPRIEVPVIVNVFKP